MNRGHKIPSVEAYEAPKINSSALYRVSTPDYFTFLQLSVSSALKYYDRYTTLYRDDYVIPTTFLSNVAEYCSISLFDVALVIFLSILWSQIRIFLTQNFFIPWAYANGLSKLDREKLPESAWKLLFYSCTFSWSCYTMLISGNYKTFQDPLSIWDDWTPTMAVPWDIYATYAVQASFYLHSVYATLYMDVWRKDSHVMILHHFLTMALIIFSYSVRHHMEGALVLFLHDVTDIQLEFTKINTYMKKRAGSFYAIHEWLANVGFAAFAVSWFIFRLYWFPLKVLYAGGYGTIEMGHEGLPFIPIFNALLWLLLLLNIWWFKFILILLYKVGTGQMNEVDDVREDIDDEIEPNGEKIKQKSNGDGALSNNTDGLMNGNTSSSVSDKKTD